MWSWGDGDYGKLGRGGSDGCKTPKLIEKLQDLDIVKVRCGSQFSIALTKDGQVYTWGKGDNQRLGHGTEEHVRYPKLLEGLKGNYQSWKCSRALSVVGAFYLTQMNSALSDGTMYSVTFYAGSIEKGNNVHFPSLLYTYKILAGLKSLYNGHLKCCMSWGLHILTVFLLLGSQKCFFKASTFALSCK